MEPCSAATVSRPTVSWRACARCGKRSVTLMGQAPALSQEPDRAWCALLIDTDQSVPASQLRASAFAQANWLPTSLGDRAPLHREMFHVKHRGSTSGHAEVVKAREVR